MKNGENEFWGNTPPIKKNRVPKKSFVKNEKKSKLFKIAWNGEKIGRKWVLDFLAPPPQKKKNWGGVQHFFVENEKNQSCSKLPEMARKLVENKFWTF